MIKKKTNMFTLDEKQHTQQTLTLPSSFLGSAFSGCHNIGNFWDNPKGAGIVYKAAAPARCLLNQNKIHSAQTLVHSWVAQDNLKQAGWALVKYSAGPHAACDLSCYRSLSPSLSLSAQTVFSASVFPSLCLFSASCSTSSAGRYVPGYSAWGNMAKHEERWESKSELLFPTFPLWYLWHTLTNTNRQKERVSKRGLNITVIIGL